MSRSVTLGLLLAVAVALVLRCPQLNERPMHNDEAVNAIKFRTLWEQGSYKYDPNEHHGPSIFYFTLAWEKCTGAPDFAHFEEARFRLVTVLFGVGLILLLPLVADGLGRGPTVCAGVLTAISPAMVFYSRYYIHEMLLVFFTFLALAAGWRYTRSQKIGWALLAGVALGLMQATKETFVLTLVAMAGALVLNGIWMRRVQAGGAGIKIERKLATGAHSSPSLPSAGERAGERRHTPSNIGDIKLKESERTPLPSPLPFGRGEGTKCAAAALTTVSSIRLNWKHAALALGVWLAVAVVFYSSFFTNFQGVTDSIKTYLPWMKRAAGESPLVQPWYFYLERFTVFHSGRGPVWSEGLILGLAVAGSIAGFMRKGLAGANAGFLRFIAFYTLLLTIIYSSIAYKTPWCLLSFWDGMILLAGVGAVAMVNLMPRRWMKIGVSVLLLACAGQLAGQAWQASVRYGGDRGYPYGYSQTSSDILNLVEQVDAVAKAAPRGRDMPVKVIAPGSDYWPLPWYLRGFNRVGWWPEMPTDPFAPVMIVSAKFHAGLDEKKTHVLAGLFELRPGIFFELYVQTDLWRSYLEAAKTRSTEK